MKTLYLECNMGAAGDMLMGALLELHPDPEGALARLNSLSIPGVEYRAEPSVKCGISGTHMSVLVHGREEGCQQGQEEDCQQGREEHHHGSHAGHHAHPHHHMGMEEIEQMIGRLELPEPVAGDVKQVYQEIAEAESAVHACPVSEIHFHEVGMLDAVADVAGVCLLMHEISPKRVVASPVHVGSGQVSCTHGILPVPAPATAYLLRDIPVYGGSVRGELCTPTGAALLRYFVTEFGELPVMRLQKTGYGMGTKDFEAANCVRAMLGESEEAMDVVTELCCNLDDMTPEAVGFATEQLMAHGALDVYTAAVQMKKNRPGVVLTCMCRRSEREKFLELMFRYTTTLGIREYECRRYGLERTVVQRKTEYGVVRVKEASGYGVRREKAEYDDVAELAREHGVSVMDVWRSRK